MELFKRWPKKNNRFSGRFTCSLEEFEHLQANIGNIKLQIIQEEKDDGELRCIIKVLEQWMLDGAELQYNHNETESYMLVPFTTTWKMKLKARGAL